MSRIAVIGTGYVGLVTGACLSDFGHEVICVDVDAEKIRRLQNGGIPIYEPGLEDVVRRNAQSGRLSFTTNIGSAVEACEIIFIAVGTPPKEDGSADLTYVLSAAGMIAQHMNGYKVIVDKSTVPVGTARLVRETIKSHLCARNADFEFDVVSNPEFLREGAAVHDFTHPDRVVIGSSSKKAMEIMKGVYRVLYLNETPFIEVNEETAEMIKYASNAFLAVKISFINEIANLCEKVGANVQDVAKAMGRDGRIGPKFLHAGPGFGGSCFPKDTAAIADLGRHNGCPMSIIEAAIQANKRQKLRMVEKIEEKLGALKGKTIGVLGLSFKPNTDDMREAPSITIINELCRKGALIRAYDPVAMDEAKKYLFHLSDRITYCEDAYRTTESSHALVIITEWNQFRNLDLQRIKEKLDQPYFFDLRNLYKRDYVEAYGFDYTGVGQ